MRRLPLGAAQAWSEVKWWALIGLVAVVLTASILAGAGPHAGTAFIAVAGAALAALRPDLLFALYSASVPFAPIAVVDAADGVTLSRFLGAASAAGLLGHALVSQRLRRPAPSVFAWGALFVWAGTSVFWATDPSHSATMWLIHVQFFLLYVVAVTFPFSHRTVAVILDAIRLSGVLAAALVVGLYFSEITYLGGFRAGLSLGDNVGDPNHTAASLLVPLCLAAGRLIKGGRLGVLLHALSVAILMSGIVVTGSRGGLLAASAGLALLAALHLPDLGRAKLRVLTLLAFVAVVVSVVVSALPPLLFERFSSDDVLARGGAGRLEIWAAGLDAWATAPLFGHAFGSFSATQLASRSISSAAHNIYLQLLVELGPLGLALLVAALALSLRGRPMHKDSRSALAGAAGVLLASAFLGTLNYHYFWLSVILTQLLHRTDKLTASMPHRFPYGR